MAYKQNTLQRLFNACIHKFLNQTPKTYQLSSSNLQSMILPNPDRPSATRFLHRRPHYLSSQEKLLESQLTVADIKKIVKVSQINILKLKLRNCGRNHVSYDEFVRMCVDGCCSRDEGLNLARILDNSGSVLVLGNVVFLKPAQVVKGIQRLMPVDNLAVKQLEDLERWKSEIDGKAVKMVKRELWGGLGYLVVQTSVFIRLTFWELSWDVMEPICVYVTSLYFMLGFAYFIRTKREPCFEAVFQNRFRVKQIKLMKMEGFDVEKYNELKKICGSRDQACQINESLFDVN